jgi:hypothetical protein
VKPNHCGVPVAGEWYGVMSVGKPPQSGFRTLFS